MVLNLDELYQNSEDAKLLKEFMLNKISRQLILDRHFPKASEPSLLQACIKEQKTEHFSAGN